MIWVKVGAVIVLLMVIAIVIGSFMRDDFSLAERNDDDEYDEFAARRHPTERPPEPLPRPRFRARP